MAEPKSNFVNTSYNGATVTNEVAEQLKQQPAAELLRFTQQGDKTVVQTKLPEKGAFGDPAQEYDIRVNMNYLMRGIARNIMGPDGSIDPKKMDALDDWMFETDSAGKVDLNALMDKFEVPKDQARRDDFKRFLAANGIEQNNVKSFLFGSTGPIAAMTKEVFSQLAGYQLAVSGKQGPEAKEYAQGYQVEYEQMLRQYRDMANMDPLTEQRVLVPMDCIGYANMNNNFLIQHNAYRKAKGQGEIPFQTKTVAFKAKNSVLDENGEPTLQDEYNAFNEHHYVTLPVTINGQDSVLSLEATAPPDGDLFHRRDAERTGVGIFPNAEAVEQYHKDNNVRKADFLKGIPGAKEREIERKLKKAGLKTQGEPDAPMLTQPKRSYHGYLLAHTGARTGQMNDKQLAEAASKALMASYFMNDPKAPEFNVGTIRKAAENLRTSPQFLAVLRVMGDKARDALVSGDITKIAARMYEDPDKRYEIKDASKKQLRELGEGMKTEKRSAEWVQLKRALTDPGMKNSMDVIAAVEQYTKGKKSVRRTLEGRQSFQLAMKALAIAARDGDDVAKQRAKILADRINAVRKARQGSEHYIDLEALAPAAPAAQAGQFDAGKYLESLVPHKNEGMDLWIKGIVDAYKPVPVPNEASLKDKSVGYTMEQFKTLKQYDVSKLPVGGEAVTDLEFTALTGLAIIDKDISGLYVNGTKTRPHDIIKVENMKPSVEIALQKNTCAFLELGASNGHAGRRMGGYFEGVGQPTRQRVFDALRQYRQGDKKLLGEIIGKGVDMTVNKMNFTPDSVGEMPKDMETYTVFVNAAVKLAQRDPELRRIAEKNGLTKENLARLSGLQQSFEMARTATAAKDKLLTDKNLTPEERKACVTAVLRHAAFTDHVRAEHRKKYDKLDETYGRDDEEDETELERAFGEETDPVKKDQLAGQLAYKREWSLGGLGMLGVLPTMQALGREGAKVTERLVDEAKIDMDKLLAIEDPEKLIRTIQSKGLFARTPGKADEYADLREGAQPRPAPQAPTA